MDKMYDRPLGEGLVKHIITWEGRKVIDCYKTYIHKYHDKSIDVVIYVLISANLSNSY